MTKRFRSLYDACAGTHTRYHPKSIKKHGFQFGQQVFSFHIDFLEKRMPSVGGELNEAPTDGIGFVLLVVLREKTCRATDTLPL